GQVLRLPGNGSSTPVTLAALDGSGADAEGSTYIVRSGDSIAQIARRLGIAEDVLLAQNGISDRNRIFVGQELRLSGGIELADEQVVLAALEEPADTALVDLGGEALVEDSVAVAAGVQAEPGADAEPEVANAAGVAEGGLSRAEEQRLLAVEATLAILTEGGPSVEDDAAVDAGLVSVEDVDGAAFAFDSEAVGESPDGALRVDAAQMGDDGTSPVDPTSPESNVLSSEQAELAADPSNYLVAPDDTIEVQALETLGHYADWLGIRTQRLRDINRLPFGQAVVIGERLKLEFDAVDSATFEQRRVAYQQSTQEAFFRSYQITDTVEHVVRPGEALWVLALRRYRVPVWLVRQFNPDLNLDQVSPGTVVKFPALKPIATAEDPAQVADGTDSAPLPAE
ncbi:MAG TPA: LysM domain-containing protein, partial [Gammaproteobacteria bacterium]|nr:LysM domain-containing protein [Gammaproteobacteria bacterium]